MTMQSICKPLSLKPSVRERLNSNISKAIHYFTLYYFYFRCGLYHLTEKVVTEKTRQNNFHQLITSPKTIQLVFKRS